MFKKKELGTSYENNDWIYNRKENVNVPYVIKNTINIKAGVLYISFTRTKGRVKIHINKNVRVI